MAATSHAGSLRIHRPVELGSVELHTGTSFRHSYPRHWHEEFYVSAITAGCGKFDFHGTEYFAIPGSLVVVAPGEVHTHDDFEGGRSFRSMHMPWDFVASTVAERMKVRVNFHSAVFGRLDWFHRFNKLHRCLEGDCSRLKRDSLLLTFFQDLFQNLVGEPHSMASRGIRESGLKRAKELLSEKYDREVSLKELASAAELSPYHFHRAFSRQMGMPPHAFQIQLRVLKAKSLLRTKTPIAEVALATGFCDQSHFTRHFKRLVGVTPAQYSR